MPLVKVEIPLDGTIPPCPHCGAITVTLDGKAAPCSLAECPSRCQAGHPNPPYRMIGHDRQGREIDETARRFRCYLLTGHDGPHEYGHTRWER